MLRPKAKCVQSQVIISEALPNWILYQDKELALFHLALLHSLLASLGSAVNDSSSHVINQVNNKSSLFRSRDIISQSETGMYRLNILDSHDN